MGATATVFVISDLIDKTFVDQPVMSEQMLRSLRSKGWEIGSHTRTHPHLTKLSDLQVDAELRDSKKFLEKILSAKVASFAYPFGDYDARIKAIAARHYTFARSGSWYPPLRVNSLHPRDRMDLRAVNAYEHPVFLPLHLFTIHVAGKIRYRTRKQRNPNVKRGWINPSAKMLEGRFVKKWLRNLRKDQWLILTFHNISENPLSTPMPSIGLAEFREIVRAIDQNAEVVNMGEAVEST